jgi:type IV secretory pathway VirB2 component (pilin)
MKGITLNKNSLFFALTMTLTLMFPVFGFCSVESSLMAVQTKLIGTILPLVSILGLVFAGLSFVAGSPNARTHLMLAMLGAAIGFGAPSIVSWIQGLIH